MIKIFILCLLFNFCFIVEANCQQVNNQQQIFTEIRDSHLEANIPGKAEFDMILKRDLEKYFLKPNGKVSVTYTMLREGPTQSGIAYPKYYVWSKIYIKGKLLDEGAVRVAAIDRAKFEITDFVKINILKKDPSYMYSIFPVLVCDKIKEKL